MRKTIPNLKLGEGIEKLKISQRNIEIIEKVKDDVRNDGIKEQSVRDKYGTPLRKIAYILDKDFDKCVREDLKKLNGWINTCSWGWDTKEKSRIAIRRLYRILYDTDENPEIVKDIKTPKKDRRKPKPEMPKKMIKTNQEIDKLIPYFKNNRDKLHLAINWNTGARCVEIRTSKWGQLYLKDGNLKIEFETAKNSGDTEKRSVLLHYALPYIHRWKQEYKEHFGIEKDEDLNDLYIFRKFNDKENKSLGQQYFIKVYKEVGEKSGLKFLTPKLFRKYFLSRMQREGVPDAIIKKLVGHSKDSRQLSHYSFHDEDDCDKALLRVEGMQEEHTEKPKPSIIKCKRCFKENKIKNEFCEFCGFGLTENAFIKSEEKHKTDIQNFKLEMDKKFSYMQEILLISSKPNKTREDYERLREIGEEISGKKIELIYD